MFKTEHIECKNCEKLTRDKLRELDSKLYNLGLRSLRENVSFDGSKVEPLNKNLAIRKQLEKEQDEIINNQKIYYCEEHN